MHLSDVTADATPFESLVKDIYTALGDPSIDFYVFWTSSQEITTGRYVVWRPSKFKCSPTSANAGALFTDHLIVESLHYAPTFSEAYEIRVRCANAVRRVMKKSSTPTEGYYGAAYKPFFQSAWMGDISEWANDTPVIQHYVWEINVPLLDGTFDAHVKQIDIVDSTQITTVVDGVLTPSETTEIKE